MLSFLLNCFWNGVALPEIQILSSASRSKVPPVSMLKCVMLQVPVQSLFGAAQVPFRDGMLGAVRS